MGYIGQTDYPHEAPQPKRAVLLCNLGTPDDTSTSALRRYLKQFLSDPRVIEVNPWLWKIILNCFILPFRPKKSAAMYKKVWTEQGSPLLLHSLEQKKKLQLALTQQLGQEVIVELAMCYGAHSVAEAVASLKAQDVREVVVLPLYPQYCAATTAATFDAVAQEYMRYRWVPQLHFIHGYHQEPLFIEAIARSIQQHITAHGQPETLIFSYHGTPKSYRMQGDPYACFCLQTTRLVCAQLKLSDDQVMTTFQSRFGKQEWLKPYTDEVLEDLAQKGTRHVAVICPGFSADCLETLEEIAQEGRDSFLEHGGEVYHYIPALNSTQEHIDFLAMLTMRSFSIPSLRPVVATKTVEESVS
tara:strand:- start:4591 stop:5661 length:1071 start_codon:yes stop_codon:yes gene_type:complete